VHYSSLPQLSIFFENAERVNGLKQNVLTTLERPGQPWEVITLDLIEGLACSANHDTTLAVVDKKISPNFVILSLRNIPFGALDVAKACMANNVFAIHGLPWAINCVPPPFSCIRTNYHRWYNRELDRLS
jgi:hypothetical protein